MVRIWRLLCSAEVLVFVAVLAIGSLTAAKLEAACSNYTPTGCTTCDRVDGDTYCSNECGIHYLCSKTEVYYLVQGEQFCFDVCAVGYRASCPGLCDF
jgi:hypothetical protein